MTSKSQELMTAIRRAVALIDDETLCGVLDEDGTDDAVPWEIYRLVWAELKTRHPRRFARYEEERKASLSQYILKRV
jgi:hypothetical protein